MGFFSWKTSDTKESISNKYSVLGTSTVYVLLPDGGHIKESHYEGYGVFGGHDIYALVAQWNCPEKCTGDEQHDRIIGIKIALSDEDNAALEYPIKIVRDPEISYEEAEPSENDPAQGYFYDEAELADWDEEI